MPGLDRALIAGVPLFQGLTPAQQDDVLRDAHSVRFPKGSDVFQQDQEASSFFFLLHGHLRVFRLTPDGQQVVVRYISAGEIFGVAMALGRNTFPATANAVVDSLVLVWPTSVWPKLSESYPVLVANTLRTVGSRLQDANTRVVEMSTEQVERRIAHALLRLAQQLPGQCGGVQSAGLLCGRGLRRQTGRQLCPGPQTVDL